MCDTSTTPQYQLALIVREETDDGRDNVRFLKHVAYGELDFRRLQAATKELLLRGFGPVSDWPEHVSKLRLAPTPILRPRLNAVAVACCESQDSAFHCRPDRTEERLLWL